MAGTMPTGDWSDRVAYGGGDRPFAYRPGEVVVAGERARDMALEVTGLDADVEPVFPEEHFGPGTGRTQLFRVRGEIDPMDVAAELRLEGLVGQPNHVLFAHGDDCCCRPHPADRSAAGTTGAPVYGAPVYGAPVYGAPVYGAPVYGAPVYGAPVYGAPVYGAGGYATTGHRHSSARPADPPPQPATASTASAGGPRIVVLDTGLAGEHLRPAAVAGVACAAGDCDEPDEDGDHYLDPAAGHGTFIAGLIAGLAPGSNLSVQRVLTTYGDGDEVTIARAIVGLPDDVDILNLSFGGYAMETMDVLGVAVRTVQKRGTVVVASAGNDATCRPTFPAALPGVVGVGAVGPDGPARFTNYGSWVRACAPGVDIVSAFFERFDGPDPAPPGGTDPDRFRAWARWSGTSFSAPIVAAALAREMSASGCSVQDAVARIVDAPRLLRIADLGTVVNL